MSNVVVCVPVCVCVCLCLCVLVHACVPGQGGEDGLSQVVCTTLPGLQVLPAAHPHPLRTCYSLSQGKRVTLWNSQG